MRLQQLVKESQVLEDRAILVSKTTQFFSDELDRLSNILDEPGLSYDKRKETLKQLTQILKRMEKELVLIGEEEKALVEHEKKFDELIRIRENKEIEED